MYLYELPVEVMYMILNQLTFDDKANIRLTNRALRKTASYIFKEIKLRNRSDVDYFAEVVKRTPNIGAHVRSIKVSNAAVLRALSSSCIRKICLNINTIDITNDQGRGIWGRSLSHYPQLQHIPTLEDDKNAQEALMQFRLQLSTLKLGGPLLVSFTIPQLTALLNMTPNIRTLSLLYPFKARLNNVYQDLKGSLTFEDVNTILKHGPNIRLLELQHCEIANISLLRLPQPLTPEVASDLRTKIAASSLVTTNEYRLFFHACNSLTHIKMHHIAVVNMSEFLRSMLDSFIYLKNIDLNFLARFSQLDVGPREWDTVDSNSDVWSRDLNHICRLETLKLRSIGSRLNVPDLLLMLAKASSPLKEIALVGLDKNIDTTMFTIFERFSMTLRRLTFHCRHQAKLSPVLVELNHLEYFDIQWTRLRFEPQLLFNEIFRNARELREFRFGYENISPSDDSSLRTTDIFTSLAKLNLCRLLLNQSDLRNLLLPLVNLEEAIFEQCVFHVPDVESRSSISFWDVDNREMYDQLPNLHGEVENKVRKELFQLMEYAYDPDSLGNEYSYPLVDDNNEDEESAEARVRRYIPTLNDLSVREIRNKIKYLTEARRDNLQLRSLSLKHLGLHDCKLRLHGLPLTTAKAIRNFEVILDARSGCNSMTNIDRAIHEKKNCNPHIVVNKVKRTIHNISYNFTHEFGGTLGRNNYQVLRPTFRIRMFSLDKLSIRPKSLMSIYFKNTDESRLTTCNQYTKRLIKKKQSVSPSVTTSMLIGDDLKTIAQRENVQSMNNSSFDGDIQDDDSMEMTEESDNQTRRSTTAEDGEINQNDNENYDLDLEVNPYAMRASRVLEHHNYHLSEYFMEKTMDIEEDK
jgi:hypothetical protein